MTGKLDNLGFAEHMRSRRGESPIRKQAGTIYMFSLDSSGGDGMCVALSECGVLLAEHYCSSEIWGFRDLADDAIAGRLAGYAAFYPEGYILQSVRADQRAGSAGWGEACGRHILRAKDNSAVAENMRGLLALAQSQGQA